MTDTSLQNPNEAQITLRFEEFASFVEQFSGRIALGGIFVETPKVRPVGTEVQLTCQLGDGYQLLRGLGDVVWVRPKDDGAERPAGMGIRFNALDAKSRELVLKIVEENLKDGGEPFEITQVPPGASTEAPPAASDMSLDDLSEDPTLVGSVTASAPSAPAAPSRPAAGPGFAAPWGEKLPEIPVDIFGDESDPEVDEAVRSIRPDPSLVPPSPEEPMIDPNGSAEFPVPEVAAGGRELAAEPDDAPFDPPEEDELTFEPDDLAFDPPEEDELTFESEPVMELESEAEPPLDESDFESPAEDVDEPEDVSFGDRSAEIVFEPPADDLDELDMEVEFDDADDASFGDVSFDDSEVTFDSEVKFEADDFDGDMTAPGASAAGAAVADPSFDEPSFDEPSFEEPFEEPGVSSPTFESTDHDDAPEFGISSFDEGVDFDGDITAPSAGSSDEFASPDLDFTPPADDFSTPADDFATPPADDFSAPVDDFAAPPAADFSAPVDDFAVPPADDFSAPVDDFAVPPADDFSAPPDEPIPGSGFATEEPHTAPAGDYVDAWEGEGEGESSSLYGDESGVAVASDAEKRSLPVVPILAAVLVLAALGAAYFFRGELAALVGLADEPTPVATSAQRPAGPAPAPPPTDPAAAELAGGDDTGPLGGGETDDAAGAESLDEAFAEEPSTFEPEPTPAPAPPATAPARRETAASRASASGTAAILGISPAAVAGGTRVTVQLDRPVDSARYQFNELQYNAVKQGLYLFDMANTYPQNRISIDTRELSFLEIGFHESNESRPTDELHLIFNQARPNLPAAEVQVSGDTIVVFFRSR